MTPSTDDTPEKHYFAPPCVVLAVLILSPMIFFTMLGNLMTVLSFIIDADLRTASNLFITHMAICDLLIGAIGMPIHAYLSINGYQWRLGITLCRVFMVAMETLYTQTVYMILLVAFYELRISKQDIYNKEHDSLCKATVKVLLVETVAIMVYIYPVIFADMSPHESGKPFTCRLDALDQNPVGRVFTWVVASLLPLLGLLYTTVRVYTNINTRLNMENAVMSGKRKVGFVLNPNVPTLEVVDEAKPQAQDTFKSNLAMRRKTTGSSARLRAPVKSGKQILTLLILYLVCWSPYAFAPLISGYCKRCFNTATFQFFVWLIQMKSCISPWLLTACCSQFRMNYLRIFSYACCCCKSFFRNQPRRATWGMVSREIFKALTQGRGSSV